LISLPDRNEHEQQRGDPPTGGEPPDFREGFKNNRQWAIVWYIEKLL
jgi:hypothetical protein